MGPFTKSLNANLEKMKQRVNLQCYAIAKELFHMVIKFSPSEMIGSNYATGHLKNQWYPNEGELVNDMDSSASQDGSGSKQRVNALNGLAFYGKDGKITMANNVPYAYRAEKLGWPTPKWSGTVSPYAMVSTSITYIGGKYK